MTTTVAVIGLGAMGLPMASRLAERFTVRGFDIASERVALAAEQGVAPAASEHGAHLVDAPLSGGPVRAGGGDLLIVVGATPDALEIARPILEQLASTLSIVGERPGDGQALKTVNKLLCGVHIAAAAEALALADALGLDREKTLEALTAGAANSFMLGNRGPRALQAYDEQGAEGDPEFAGGTH